MGPLSHVSRSGRTKRVTTVSKPRFRGVVWPPNRWSSDVVASWVRDATCSTHMSIGLGTGFLRPLFSFGDRRTGQSQTRLDIRYLVRTKPVSSWSVSRASSHARTRGTWWSVGARPPGFAAGTTTTCRPGRGRCGERQTRGPRRELRAGELKVYFKALYI